MTIQVHFINLTNGLSCPHTQSNQLFDLDEWHYIRIQSTHCEQKLWHLVLDSVTDDLLMHMVLGHECVIHDYSEKPRATRACWQGVSLIKRIVEQLLGLPMSPITGRGGKSLEIYLDSVIFNLIVNHEHRLINKMVPYYKKFLCTSSINIHHCGAVREKEHDPTKHNA